MSSDQHQDQLFPMREEMQKHMRSLHVSEPTVPSSSPMKQPKQLHTEPTKTLPSSAKPKKQHHSEPLQMSQIPLFNTPECFRSKDTSQIERFEIEEENRRRTEEWQRQRRTPMQDFSDTYAEYKADQERKDKEREDFNKKYTKSK